MSEHTQASKSKNQDNQVEFLEEIITRSKLKDDAIIKFAKAFYSYIPLDYMDEENIDIFATMLKEQFNILKKRDFNKRNIFIKNCKNSEDEEFTKFTILSDNKPFIVDSLKNLFSKYAIDMHFFFHPVIRVKRDKNGALVDVLDSYSNEQSHIESFIFIKTIGKLDSHLTNKLEAKILDILDKVDETYIAWEDILLKLDKVLAHLPSLDPKLGYSEIFDYLNWLKNENFTFLGYVYFSVNDHGNNLHHIKDQLGINQLTHGSSENVIYDIIDQAVALASKDKISLVGKLNAVSPVYKTNYIDYALIKDIDSKGNFIGGHVFLGLYSSSLHYQSVKNIPVLRHKLQYCLSKSGFVATGYNAKRLSTIIESMPRELLFYLEEDELYKMGMTIISAMTTKRLKLVVNKAELEDFLYSVVFMPSERLTPEAHGQINQFLSNSLNRNVLSSHYYLIGQHNFGYLYIVFDRGTRIKEIPSNLQEELDNLTSLWQDGFRAELLKHHGEKLGLKYFKDAIFIFSKEYRNYFYAKDAVEDLDYIYKASETNSVLFNFKYPYENNLILKIYSPKNKLQLSSIIPIIENLGFNALNEQTFRIFESPENCEIWIHEFNLTHEKIDQEIFDESKENIEDVIEKMFNGLMANDSLCRLVLLAGLDWREITVLKALTRYLHQTQFSYGKGYVQLTLIKHARFSKFLLKLFKYKFCPAEYCSKKEQHASEILIDYLNTVASSTEDKVLRSMLDIVDAIVRTNCYQKDSTLEFSRFISFKFNPSKIPNLPLPRPYAEIFVFSQEFEGVHLRGGKVARGGLRWSDRSEDYRTEVLGLMKAQMTKNTVIVPVGSKGGFFVKASPETMTKEAYRAKVIECYQNFLRGLLDITDNIIKDQIVRPAKTVVLDGDDPYLVVAADKGTATFSDFANEVAKEYNFWLSDAFASGGSAGYDHKKMGITARGAWVAVQNHFLEMGIDVQKDTITVAGIGDMSGDVFGNGLLQSKTVKLVAAFNHQHIFIDPHPDAKNSYKERQRLFKLPGSRWSDYNPELISEGGGVFDRSLKFIELTPQMQYLLNTHVKRIAPEDLIQLILTANVDLIWNGGIGTYFKASTESNVDIADKSNDALRVNACDVRAKVIGEGGNLGMSQLARIEFARRGGRLNTDFIDNSAGVDCSDHEVNIKIALSKAEVSGRLSRKERDTLLSEMTEEVAALVLENNYKQTRAISFIEQANVFTTENFAKLITSLQNSHLLDRKVEFLPSVTEMNKLAAAKEKLTRPELAILLSYSKMSAYNELINTKISQEKYFDEPLLNYFPRKMQVRFKDEILSHQLKQEIILTILTNDIVNRLTGVVISTIKRETGASMCDIARAYIIISEIFDIDRLWKEVDALDARVSAQTKIELYTELNKLLRRGIFWCIRNFDNPLDISALTKKYKKSIVDFSKIIKKFLTGDINDKFTLRLQNYKDAHVPANLGMEIAKLDTLVSAFDITLLSNKTGVSQEKVAKLYFQIGDWFHIDWLRRCCDGLLTDSYWNRLALQSLKDDLYANQRLLLEKLIQDGGANVKIPKWTHDKSKNIRIYSDFIEDLKMQDNMDNNMIILAVKKFEIFLQNI